MIRYKRCFLKLFGAALVLPLLGVPLSSIADSACKGLSKSACGANSTCAYVSGYARKDGTKVNAHCRVKGKGQAKKKTEKATKGVKGETKKATEKKAKKKTTKKEKSSTKSNDKSKSKSTKKSSKKKTSSGSSVK